jgi:Ribosomal protein L11 methylase
MTDSMRFAFGRNWKGFIKRSYSPERLENARRCLLNLLGLDDLAGKTFLDVGSGSGLHSLAAFNAGAERIVSFDYDPLSVETTRLLRERQGNPENWTVLQGSVLDTEFLSTLPRSDIVYSWGVLHHTGSVWEAIDNTVPLSVPGGLVALALYSSNVQTRFSPEFWLDVKKRYNQAGWSGKRKLECWYVWEVELGRNPIHLPGFLRSVLRYRASRGMDYYTDIKDWLGGWPMEFVDDGEVVDRLEKQHHCSLVRMNTGEANTEFLFRAPERENDTQR